MRAGHVPADSAMFAHVQVKRRFCPTCPGRRGISWCMAKKSALGRPSVNLILIIRRYSAETGAATGWWDQNAQERGPCPRQRRHHLTDRFCRRHGGGMPRRRPSGGHNQNSLNCQTSASTVAERSTGGWIGPRAASADATAIAGRQAPHLGRTRVAARSRLRRRHVSTDTCARNLASK